MSNTISIQFDGGCEPNPGRKYGSFAVKIGNDVLEKNRVELGHGTNNEAEFETLILALRETMQFLQASGLNSADFRLMIKTDSMIVLNRLTKKNVIHTKPAYRESSERMYNLACECLSEMIRFERFEVQCCKNTKRIYVVRCSKSHERLH